MSEPSSGAEEIRPDVLASHITSLFQVAFSEIGIFTAVFLAITKDRAFTWGWTYVGVALFMAFLVMSAFHLMTLHSLKPRSSTEMAKRYRYAWGLFFAANSTIMVYFVLWWLHMRFPGFMP